MIQNLSSIQDERVSLDVGGVVYATTKKILTKYPNSMLGTMFSGRHNIKPNSEGNFFIDRDGDLFRYILNFLRDGTVTIPEQKALEQQLYAEIDFFQLSDMLSILQEGKTKDYSFSSMWKHSAIQLSNLYTAEHTAWHVNWASVFVRPAIKSTSPPKMFTIRFDAFDFFQAIQVGVFLSLPNSFQETPAVAYKADGTMTGTCKYELLEIHKSSFEEGDTIGILVNFVSWDIEFWKKNKRLAKAKLPALAKLEEVYIGVSMWWRNKVTLLLEK
uniref:BTB domain-containing protein n=1 Tax=Arcella intermedia TaxID=1963864 RepID=A0A6B2LDG4_9EUKA